MVSSCSPISERERTDSTFPGSLELYFASTEIEIPAGSENHSLDIYINTASEFVTGLILEIQFGPQYLHVSELTPNETFLVTLSSTKASNTLTLALGTYPGISITGIQKIATLTFDTQLIQTSTQIKFTGNTQVAAIGKTGNVLNTSIPALIHITEPPSPPDDPQAIEDNPLPFPQSTLFDESNLEETPLESTLGCTYFVSSTGDDDTDGSFTSPFGTIQKGVNNLSPGDILCVRDGTYHQMVNVRTSGTSSKPITVMAYPGEQPVIDGRSGENCLNCGLPLGPIANTDPVSGKGFNWNPLVGIEGDFVHFEGFTITRSMGRCVRIWRDGGHVTGTVFRNNRIHDCRDGGIVFLNSPDHTLIENNEISLAGSFATYSRSAGTLDWSAGIAAIFSTNTTIRGNVVHENWGEGVIIGRDSAHTVFEDNILYDNYALQLYLHATDNALVQRNLLYHSGNSKFYRGGKPSACIVIASAEPQWNSGDVAEVQVINNIAAGCHTNLAIWDGVGAANGITVEHNTLIHASNPLDPPVGLRVGFSDEGKFDDVRIANNIVLQDHGELIIEYGQAGVIFNSNLWSRGEIPTGASSSEDVIGDPQLFNSQALLVPGTVSSDWYRLTPSSPAIDAAGRSSEIISDFFGVNRDSRPDLGALEYTIQIPEPTSTPLSTPTQLRSIPSDIDGDGDVDLDDYEILVAEFGKQGPPGTILADIDQDGSVTIYDYNILQMNIGILQTDSVQSP